MEQEVQNEAANERLVLLNSALKICRIQLSSLKLEQDQRVKLERAHKRLELKYIEARKKLAHLTVENALLSKALVKHEEIIEDVSNHGVKRELKMRTLNADVANRQHQESANLEAERQRLRLLVKKRIPGHVKTKSVDKRTSLMIEKLSGVQEENRALKESECERENGIQILKAEKVERNLEEKVLELENKMVSLEMELERVNELKRTNEDRFENLKLINVELEHQLSGAKVEFKEASRKASVLEMALEYRSHEYEGLEVACLELQLQLATVSSNKEVITELSNDKKLSQLSSLPDHMAAGDCIHREDLVRSPMIKEILNTTETKDPPVPDYNTRLLEL